MRKIIKRNLSFTLIFVFMLISFQPSIFKVFAYTNSDFTIDANGVLTKYNGAGGDVVIPDGVKSIGDNAFNCCTSLTNIEIPNSVISIGASVFAGCTSLTNINIPNSVINIGHDSFYCCTKLANVIIGENVDSIGDCLFAGCTKLVSIDLGKSIRRIGKSEFEGCASLNSIIIPDSVTSIDYYAFLGCTSLTCITIPNSIDYIEKGAFNRCNSLTIYSEPNSYVQTYAETNNILFRNVAGNSDVRYSNAYSAVSNAIGIRTQNSINNARTAIDALKETEAAWAVGEFSKQVDQVQQPILVNIIAAINKAQGSLKQSDINAAKASIVRELPSNWASSYSSAVDDIQRILIRNAIAAHNRAVTTKVQADIDIENALIKDIETASDSSIVQWIDAHVKGYNGII